MVKGIDWMLEEADMPDVMFDDCIEQITRLYASLKQRPDTSITDDMISQAKAVRIDSILEFRRGKCHCIAPDHQDKNPSAYYGSRANVLVCPVCDRKWDAIAVQMHFTGQTFKQAVRELCG
jgi:DNA primase